MSSIIYIGMDVHTTNFTICAYSPYTGEIFDKRQVGPDPNNVKKYIERLKGICGEDEKYVCGYEAGNLGYSLYNSLKAMDIECVIIAPSTIKKCAKQKRRKNDWYDSEELAKCLASGDYKSVYVPTDKDDSVKEYIRMRDDVSLQMKQTKQHIIAFCQRHGFLDNGTSRKWTVRYRQWLKSLVFTEPLLKETMDEYLLMLQQLEEKLEHLDKRIEELAERPEYKERVDKLICFKGITQRTALPVIVETGDFSRFPTAGHYASYLGLIPGEHSSGESINHLGITKAGNSHLRMLLVEASQNYGRGTAGVKSAGLKSRQKGQAENIVMYADRANERLRKKFIRIALNSSSNIAKVAVARELACFIWGMMNDKTS